MNSDFALEWAGNMAFEPTSANLFRIAMVLYFVAALCYFFYLAYRSDIAGTIGTALGAVGVVSHLGSMVYRALASGNTPLTNMYEYTSMFAFMLGLAFLGIQIMTKNKTFGGFAFASAFILMGVARIFYKDPSPLMPALKSYWLELHVFTMVISSGTLGVAFLLALLYVVKEAIVKKNGELPEGSLLARIPSLDALDDLSYRTTAFGFPLWTIGIIAGGVWAEQAWGRYWGWDPKETWSFITWLIYAGYLHARITAGWRGRSAAYLSAIGFAAVLFTFFAVNLVLSGLHSYS